MRDAVSFGNWFPDEFGNVDHEVWAVPVWIVRRPDLSRAHAYDVIEAAVRVAVAEAKDAAEDLPSPWWVSAAIPVPIEHDRHAVVGVDDGAEVWTERPRWGSAMQEVPELTHLLGAAPAYRRRFDATWAESYELTNETTHSVTLGSFAISTPWRDVYSPGGTGFVMPCGDVWTGGCDS